MTDARRAPARLTTVFLIAALALAACGRKGDLDPPAADPAPKSGAATAETRAA